MRVASKNGDAVDVPHHPVGADDETRCVSECNLALTGEHVRLRLRGPGNVDVLDSVAVTAVHRKPVSNLFTSEPALTPTSSSEGH